ncbi:chaperonin GroES [Paenibacillus cellulosilyticus]|uniref:Co-chaperonin GroES n=1 Tax=Paenibacillus cellulosilyticus TaxID=375489 RepID=A0A2V2YUC4_9BACL|nr:co-chaperone GroES [Paenibacillus cellulosilyticus]PWW03227.1 chaperonin GroES [Paenibacillus cellulosilyticus]QKS43716.1 co-chaperone GroES [Paenibacillus cellulosilyticus]
MIKPIGDRIIIEPIEQEEKTAGGILLPGTAKEKPQEGKVVAVGIGAFRDGQRVAPEVQVGDRVLFNKFAGTELKVDGTDVLLMHESDVLAILS